MSVQAGFAELGVVRGDFSSQATRFGRFQAADIEAEYLADYLQHLGQTPVPKIPRVAWPQLMSLIELTMTKMTKAFKRHLVLENSS